MKTKISRRSILLILVAFLFNSCVTGNQKKENMFSTQLQAISLFGDSLFSSEPGEKTVKKYELAKSIYNSDKNNADNLVWFGRWTAYTGNYKEAIKIFTKGTEQFPEDARFYRHRAHRYISTRQFDLAIKDLEYASELIENKKDMVEPDGMPNAINMPISSLHSNIRYHLGLAYYLSNQLEKALEVYRKDVALATNDDKMVSSSHWLYMISRLLNDEETANRVLEPINREMNIIENFDYHQLLLFYKGELIDTDLLGENYDVQVSDGMAYGIANYYFYNGETEKAKSMLEKIISGKQWASFGFIAAEADYLKYFSE